SRDGCDIALCKIQGNTLSYAGAYRPLYLFYKNGDFVEIKATKTAIAGITPYDQEFVQHQFNISDLKAVYMFSDGYADQFGGQKSPLQRQKLYSLIFLLVVKLSLGQTSISYVQTITSKFTSGELPSAGPVNKLRLVKIVDSLLNLEYVDTREIELVNYYNS